jgi:hypothetical protein
MIEAQTPRMGLIGGMVGLIGILVQREWVKWWV